MWLYTSMIYAWPAVSHKRSSCITPADRCPPGAERDASLCPVQTVSQSVSPSQGQTLSHLPRALFSAASDIASPLTPHGPWLQFVQRSHQPALECPSEKHNSGGGPVREGEGGTKGWRRGKGFQNWKNVRIEKQ